MMIFSKPLIAALACAGCGLSSASTAAVAHPSGALQRTIPAQSGVVRVHDAHDDEDDDDWDGRRHHRGRRHVDAPYTHVETGRRVVVEAPFASVYVGRRGRHIRAPFVNLWIPR